MDAPARGMGNPGERDGRAAVPFPGTQPTASLDTASPHLADAVSWLHAAALQAGRSVETQGGVMGGAREQAATAALLAARRALQVSPTPGEGQAGATTAARGVRRVAARPTASEDDLLLSEDAAVTRSGVPLHPYERRDPRIGSAYQATVPALVDDTTQPRLPPYNVTPRMDELAGVPVWPPPGMAPVPDSLLGLGPFMFTGTGLPLTRIPHRTALPLSAPPPWPGSREGTAARAARAARAGAATVTLLHALGDELISNALGMHRIGAADGQDWSLLEVASFAAAFERYGRDFRAVASAVNTKSVRRCVGFYYNVWKTMLVPEAVAYYDAMAAERAEASGAVNAENVAPLDALHNTGAHIQSGVQAAHQPQGHTRGFVSDTPPVAGTSAAGSLLVGLGTAPPHHSGPAAASAPWHAYPAQLPHLVAANASCGPPRGVLAAPSPLLVPGLPSQVSPALFGAIPALPMQASSRLFGAGVAVPSFSTHHMAVGAGTGGGGHFLAHTFPGRLGPPRGEPAMQARAPAPSHGGARPAAAKPKAAAAKRKAVQQPQPPAEFVFGEELMHPYAPLSSRPNAAATGTAQHGSGSLAPASRLVMPDGVEVPTAEEIVQKWRAQKGTTAAGTQDSLPADGNAAAPTAPATSTDPGGIGDAPIVQLPFVRTSKRLKTPSCRRSSSPFQENHGAGDGADTDAMAAEDADTESCGRELDVPGAPTVFYTGTKPEKAARALAKTIDKRSQVDPQMASKLLELDQQRRQVSSKALVVAATFGSAPGGANVELVAPVPAAEVVAQAVASAKDPGHQMAGKGYKKTTLVNPHTGRIYPAVPGTIESRPEGSTGGVGGKFGADVTRLLAAAFELNPFPNKATKIALAAQTGLTPEQTRVWFMNARSRGVRL